MFSVTARHLEQMLFAAKNQAHRNELSCIVDELFVLIVRLYG
jgi:hypothetical protein